MVALRPSVASYARIAYARELLGDLRGARAAMQLAADAASRAARARRLGQASSSRSWISAPGSSDAPSASCDSRSSCCPATCWRRSSSHASRRRAETSLARSASRSARPDAVPLPQFVTLLADLDERAGNRARRRRQVETVGAIDRILAANGVRTDVESVVFDADHRIRPATLVARARAARAARPSILGDDALAWALARTGRCEEARSWSDRSLRLGTRDPLLYFHRAEIERCAGNPAAARSWARRALALDPSFSGAPGRRTRVGSPPDTAAPNRERARGEQAATATTRRDA